MNRRDFLTGAAISGLAVTTLPNEAKGQAAQTAKPAVPALDDELKGRVVNVAVIGLRVRGKEIVSNLSRMTSKFVNISYICDSFAAPTFVRRAQAIAPAAKFEQDYKKVLADPAVEGVFIATPSHKHKDIAVAALNAGKHVYLEAPLANNLEDLNAIYEAAMSAKGVFQPGLQVRCNGQAIHVKDFVDSGALGKVGAARAQHHVRNSWKFGWPTPEREAELNWRLSKDTSLGLVGEIGIHQIDTATWYFKQLPTAVSGFGRIVEYSDGRSVPDTVQLNLEYPNGAKFYYDATLVNSFEGSYELFYGSVCAIMLRDQRAWMFKEGDADLIGWEVFARKDGYKIGIPENNSGLLVGSGIALVANATKQLAAGKTDLVNDPNSTSLYQANRVFCNSIRAGKPAYAKEPTAGHPNPKVAPGIKEGYNSTVVAIKAAEAVAKNTRIVLEKEWFKV